MGGMSEQMSEEEIIDEIESRKTSWENWTPIDGFHSSDLKDAIKSAWDNCPHCKEIKMMSIETVLGLTLSQIEWMKRYFKENLLEIKKQSKVLKLKTKLKRK